MKRLMMLGLVALLSACAMPMDCCKDMRGGEMCPTDGTPCKMECCKKMKGHSSDMKH